MKVAYSTDWTYAAFMAPDYLGLWRGISQRKIHREVLGKGVGKTSMWPQVAPGTKNETVLMPGSRTLISQVEIRSYITLGNSVGNMNCTLKRLQCENSDIWFEWWPCIYSSGNITKSENHLSHCGRYRGVQTIL